MRAIPGTFSAFDTVRSYKKIVLELGVSLPEGFEDLWDRMEEIEEPLLSSALPVCPCHNDLLNGNFLDDGNIRILDWEYAGMGDLFFDLANFSVNHELAEDDEETLLREYFGEVTTARLARFKLMKVMSDFREAMWGLVQSGVSALEFDFEGYAEKHFTRMQKNLSDPGYARFVKEARNSA